MMKRIRFEIDIATSATKSPGPKGMLAKVTEHWEEIQWNEDRTEGTIAFRALTIAVKLIQR